MCLHTINPGKQNGEDEGAAMGGMFQICVGHVFYSLLVLVYVWLVQSTSTSLREPVGCRLLNRPRTCRFGQISSLGPVDYLLVLSGYSAKPRLQEVGWLVKK